MRQFSLLIVVGILSACADPGPPPPPPEAEELVAVVTDVHIAEALANEVPVLLRDSMREVFFDRTLADHGLNREQFDSLLWIVRAEPVWLDSLYTRVGERLARMDVRRNDRDGE